MLLRKRSWSVDVEAAVVVVVGNVVVVVVGVVVGGGRIVGWSGFVVGELKTTLMVCFLSQKWDLYTDSGAFWNILELVSRTFLRPSWTRILEHSCP